MAGNNYRLISAAVTDTGLVRKHNEDCFLKDDSAGIYIVADGVGGHARGEVASEITCKVALQHYLDSGDCDAAINQAHVEVQKQAQLLEDAAGMGATIVMVKFQGSDVELSWVGDSRVYKYSSSSQDFTQLSLDHSLVQMMVSQGLISEQEAETHPKKNVITQAVGLPSIETLEVGRDSTQCAQGDILLLCSDGLTDMVADADIRDILARDLLIEEKANYLIGAALKGGGKDNVTVLLVELESIEKA